MSKPVECLIGKRYGRLTVLRDGKPNISNSGHRRQTWICYCDCGIEVVAFGASLRRGHTTSCGCYQRDATSERFTKHGACAGHKNSRLYAVWRAMLNRTLNEKDKAYRYYGERGITVCEEWKNDYASYQKWAKENGYDPDAPRGQCTIDRIDVDGDYCPENCRWVNMATQNTSRRPEVKRE